LKVTTYISLYFFLFVIFRIFFTECGFVSDDLKLHVFDANLHKHEMHLSDKAFFQMVSILGELKLNVQTFLNTNLKDKQTYNKSCLLFYLFFSFLLAYPPKQIFSFYLLHLTWLVWVQPFLDLGSAIWQRNLVSEWFSKHTACWWWLSRNIALLQICHSKFLKSSQILGRGT